jgi:hypothetical protein
VLNDVGDLAGAQSLHEWALFDHEKALGPEQPYTVKVRRHLAKLLDRDRESI